MGVGICVVGAGRWGRNHIRTLGELRSLAGVVETDEKARAEIAEAYPDIDVFEDLEAALSADFDGFVVASPAETHAPLARRILEAGKPVLVEKPLSLDVRSAVELAELARERNVPLMVGHLMLFHPAIRRLAELVRAGKIGKLQYLYSNRLNLGTVRTEENILWSFAPHDISIFQYLIGREPAEVMSRGGAFVQSHLHDSTLTILRYPDNVIGHVFVSWLHPYKEHRLVLIGSKGMLSFEDTSEEKSLLFYEKGIDWVEGAPIKRDGPTEVIPYERKQPLEEELRAFCRSVEGAPVELAGPENAIEVLRILERATASLLTEPDVDASPERRDVFVHPSSEVDPSAHVGAGTKIWHYSNVQREARIGRECSLGQNVNIGPRVRVGDHVKIQNNVSVYEGVELEDYVFCGPSMTFTNVLTPRAKYPAGGRYVPTRICEGATLGANCTIVCGTSVGRHAFVAAGAVVSRDVPDHARMLGVPARQQGWACECGATLPAADAGQATCERCHRIYRERETGLVEVGGEGSRGSESWTRGLGAAQGQSQRPVEARRVHANGLTQHLVHGPAIADPREQASPLLGAGAARDPVGRGRRLQIRDARLAVGQPAKASGELVQGDPAALGQGAAQAAALVAREPLAALRHALRQLRQAFVQPEGAVGARLLAEQRVGVLVEQQLAQLAGRVGGGHHVDAPVVEADGAEREAVTVGLQIGGLPVEDDARGLGGDGADQVCQGRCVRRRGSGPRCGRSRRARSRAAPRRRAARSRRARGPRAADPGRRAIPSAGARRRDAPGDAGPRRATARARRRPRPGTGAGAPRPRPRGRGGLRANAR